MTTEIERPRKAPSFKGVSPRDFVAPLEGDTATYGTETPWRDTPPNNFSSAAETAIDQSPPTPQGIDPLDADAMPEDEVPPEGEIDPVEGDASQSDGEPAYSRKKKRRR